MKLDPTVALVMTLLTLMVGATTASALWGYRLGRKALSGITQPDIRPNQILASSDGVSLSSGSEAASDEKSPGDIVLLSEADLIARAQARIDGQAASVDTASNVANRVDADEQLKSDSRDESSDTISTADAATDGSDISFINYQNYFPLIAQDDAVLMSVNSVQEQGDLLRINVSLQNKGTMPVEFLYSLMDVSDDQGQPLSASTDSLPQMIPPTGETYSGSVIIPSILVDRAESVSIRLANYPEQEVELAISGIPIRR